MLLLAVLFTMISAKNAQRVVKNKTDLVICSGLIFNNTYYDKRIIYRGSGRSLFMHEPSGDLFFSHTIWAGTEVKTQLIACHLETKMCRAIKGIPGGYSVGYDPKQDQIYFGGIDGIYAYNNITDTAELYAEPGNSVWSIFILDNFYYIEYPSQNLYVKKGATFQLSKLNIEVLTFHATKDTIYFSNRSGVYTMPKKPNAKPAVLGLLLDVRQIVKDCYGNVYFCAHDGIYTEDKTEHSLVQLADIHDAFGMTFLNIHESDVVTVTLLYSDRHSVYRLFPSEHSDICYDAIMKEKSEREKYTNVENFRGQKHKSVYVNLKLDFV